MSMMCPVCMQQKDDSVKGVRCQVCGFEHAYVEYFGSKKSLELWENEVAKLRPLKLRGLYALRRPMVLGKEKLFWRLPNNEILIFDENGVELKNDIRRYSESERNSAILHKDGKIDVFGDNSYGQCNIGVVDTAATILCGPNCTYVVNKDGSIQVFGALIDNQIKKWNDISRLSCGAFHLLGLTNDKRVRIAGEGLEESIIRKVSNWRNVKSVCAATDCSVALFEDGTVSFAGRPDDPRSESESWTKIVSVKADASFVYGLTSEGTIKVAGKCRKMLDGGRSDVIDWKNVIALECNGSAVVGLFDEHRLKIAGKFNGDGETLCTNFNEYFINKE